MELIQAVCLTPACDFLEKHGVNVDRHLKKAGLDAFSPRNPKSWLPKKLVFRFVERLERHELSSKPIEDLEPAYRIRNMHHYGQQLLSASNMLMAARRATNPKAAIMTYHKTGVGLHGGRASIRSIYKHKRERTELLIEGLSLVLMLDALVEFGGKRFCLSSLDITLNELPDTTLPIDLSRTKIRTAQSTHTAMFPMSWLAHRPKTRLRKPTNMPQADHSKISDRLLLLFDALEKGQRPTLEAIADCTGMPERTIQRKLAEENTSFFELLDQRAARVALAALKDPRKSIKEVSESLAYSEPAHFTRAFRRWTGQSPQSYRDTLL